MKELSDKTLEVVFKCVLKYEPLAVTQKQPFEVPHAKGILCMSGTATLSLPLVCSLTLNYHAPKKTATAV
jgi:hypothetical protein